MTEVKSVNSATVPMLATKLRHDFLRGDNSVAVLALLHRKTAELSVLTNYIFFGTTKQI